MKNVDVKLSNDGSKATITIDLTERHGLSSSGKTTVVATTSGNQPLGESGVILGLNAYTKEK